MKKILFLFLTFSSIMYGQITLEHSYPGASYFVNASTGQNIQQLYMVNLEVDGHKYVHIDRGNKVLNFYNLNHTPFKSISFAAATSVNPANVQDFLYISQNLFDNDNEIEFLYVDQYALNTAVTQVVNEDGTIIFTANNEAPLVKLNAPQAQVPIYNTSAGTKMILSATSGNGQVYSLPGVLSALTVKNIENPTNELSLYPNPSTNKITIENKNVLINKIVIYNNNGETIKSLSVENINSVDLDVSNLSSGEYFVQIYDKNGTLVDTKKIIRN